VRQISDAAVDGSRTTRQAILEAARRRYLRFGPRKTTMGEVAREAGCSRATLYTHFPSKQELYSRLLEQETTTFLAELELAAEGSQGAREKLRSIAEATARIYARPTALRGALARDAEMSLEQVAQPAIEALDQRVIDLLSRVLEQGVSEGAFRSIEPRLVAYLMYQLGRVLVDRERAGQADFPFAHILGAMDDLILNGVSAPASREQGAQ